MKTYKELSKLKTFEERFEYLKLKGVVGEETFGHDRYLNQRFYKSVAWLDVRERVIIRDSGCDLGVEGFEIHDKVIVHHINPITPEDLAEGKSFVFDEDNLITTTLKTHNAIHFGGSCPKTKFVERSKNDTIPWKK